MSFLPSAGGSLDGSASVGAGGVGRGGVGPVPKLATNATAAMYAAWKPELEIYMTRVGLKDRDYKVSIADYAALAALVVQWDSDDEQRSTSLVLAHATRAAAVAALQLKAATTSSAGSSSDGKQLEAALEELQQQVKAEPQQAVSAEMKAAMDHTKQLVARSARAYAVLYEAMPVELRPQVERLPKSYAFALWEFLEKKYQSTETDSVATYWGQLIECKQSDTESFDAYRARVDAVITLLSRSGETVSPTLYKHYVIDRLHARYEPVKLAINVGGKVSNAVLQSPAGVNWGEVRAHINQHERQSLGMDGSSGPVEAATAMAVREHGKSSSGGGERRERERKKGGASGPRGACYGCGKPGHYQRDCPKGKQTGGGGDRGRARDGDRGEQAMSAQSSSGCAGRGARTPRDYFSDDEDEEEAFCMAVLTVSGPGSSSVSTSYKKNCTALVERRSKRAAFRAEFPELPQVPVQPKTEKSVLDESTLALQQGVVMSAVANNSSLRGVLARKAPDSDSDDEPPVQRRGRLSKGAMANSAQPAAAAAPAARKAIPKKTVVNAQSGGVPVAAAARSAVPAAAAPAASAAPAMKPAAAPAAAKPAEKVAGMPNHNPRDVRSSAKAIAESLAADGIGVDSMASLHVTGNKGMLVGIVPCAPVTITVADGQTVTCNKRGTMLLRLPRAEDGSAFGVRLEPVYYNERFAANLLSVGRLTDEGWALTANKERAYLTTPRGTRVKLRTNGRVYLMPLPPKEMVYAVQADWSVDTLVELHAVLGHMGFFKMLTLIRSGKVHGLLSDRIKVQPDTWREVQRRVSQCASCALGKGTRTRLGHRGLDRGTKPSEVLHMDTYYVKDLQAIKHYVLAVRDAYTSHRWAGKAESKAKIMRIVTAVLSYAENVAERRCKRIHLDGGSEFIGEELKLFCEQRGIEFLPSPPYDPTRNGVAEREVRTSKDIGTTLLEHARLSHEYWWYAVKHSVYVWNRTHLSSETGVTPYEAFRGRSPSVEHLGVFGCDAFAFVQEHERDDGALPRKMQPCMYLGHDPLKNCAVVMYVPSKKIAHCNNLKYRCSSFENAAWLSRSERRPAAAYDEPVYHADDDSRVGYHGAGDQRVHFADQPRERRHSFSAGDVDHMHAAAAGARAAPSSSTAYVQRPRSSGASRAPRAEKFWMTELLEKRTSAVDGATEYLVKWDGYDKSQATWKAADAIRDERGGHLISAYEKNSDSSSSAPSRGRSTGERADDEQLEPPRGQPMFTPAPVLEHRTRASERAAASASSAEDSKENDHHTLSAVAHCYDDTTGADDLFGMVFAISSSHELVLPKTAAEARRSPERDRWLPSMDKEFYGHEKNNVWSYVHRKDLPARANVLPVKWVFKIKHNEKNEITEFKSRLTPKGFRQKEGVDYFEVFAATGKYKTMRLAISLAARWDHELVQLDVPSAFTQAKLDEEVYMQVPDGYKEGREDVVLRLHMALYGLKQAPRNWQTLFCGFLIDELGFTATVSDPMLFHKRSRTRRSLLAFVFVDDVQASYHHADADEWQDMYLALHKRFKIKLMGDSKWILGMRIRRDRAQRTLFLDQQQYTTNLLVKYGLDQCRARSVPEKKGDDREDARDLGGAQADKQRFMELTGALLYLSICTRPDTLHATHALTQHMQDPKQRHEAAAECVLRYLSGTKSLGLQFGGHASSNPIGAQQASSREDTACVSGYADADWASDRVTRRSTTGWLMFLNGDLISWQTRKQHTVSQSTCEAELYAQADVMKEIMWVTGLLRELGLTVADGAVVYGDNQSTITVSQNGIKGERTKHIDIKYHFVKEQLDAGAIRLQWIETSKQLADILTKAVQGELFAALRDALLVDCMRSDCAAKAEQ